MRTPTFDRSWIKTTPRWRLWLIRLTHRKTVVEDNGIRLTFYRTRKAMYVFDESLNDPFPFVSSTGQVAWSVRSLLDSPARRAAAAALRRLKR